MGRNIILIGLPGSGKTTLGAQAAKHFGLSFLDMDAEIERRAGLTIPALFAQEGEEKFRAVETAVAQDAARLTATVVAAGGGAVLRSENMRALRQNGIVIFLDRPPEHIVRDVETARRPLLAGGAGQVLALAGQRRPLYIANADAVLCNDSGPDRALAELCMTIRSEYPPREGFAVIGDPIGHTLSPLIHRTVFQTLGPDIPYEAIHVPKGTAGGFAERARTSGLRGFNVTIPHKRDILSHLDEVAPEAALCGAVNTVVIRDSRLCGYNTDMDGLSGALRGRGYEYKGRNVVILGTGGAARGIALKAARDKAEQLIILGRRPEAAQALCDYIQGIAPDIPCLADAMSLETLTSAAVGAELLINATPLGMTEDFLSLSFLQALPSRALVCDLIYSPQKTALLREAERLGRSVMNGLGMLIGQAVLADELFLGRKLDRAVLCEAVAGHLHTGKNIGPVFGRY